MGSEEKEKDLLEEVQKLRSSVDELRQAVKQLQNSEKLWYSRNAAAGLLSTSYSSLQQAIDQGLIRTTQCGSRRMIHRDELLRVAKNGLPELWPSKGPDGKTRRRVA